MLSQQNSITALFKQEWFHVQSGVQLPFSTKQFPELVLQSLALITASFPGFAPVKSDHTSLLLGLYPRWFFKKSHIPLPSALIPIQTLHPLPRPSSRGTPSKEFPLSQLNTFYLSLNYEASQWTTQSLRIRMHRSHLQSIQGRWSCWCLWGKCSIELLDCRGPCKNSWNAAHQLAQSPWVPQRAQPQEPCVLRTPCCCEVLLWLFPSWS